MKEKPDVFLIGLGSKLGSEVRTAEEIAEKFSKKTEAVLRNGVTKLFSLSKEEDLIDFTSRLVIDLLQKTKIELSEIRGVFGSNNTTAKFLMPSFIACVANELGLRNVICDPIGLGCSGGLQALRSAYNQAIVDSIDGKFGYYLVVAGDQFNRLLDPNDFGTSILFSEGVAVMLLSNCREGGYKIARIGTKSLLGEHFYALNIKNPYHGLNESGSLPKLKMEGPKIFAFAVNTFSDILNLIGLQSMNAETYFIPHQANLRIIEKIIKKNGLIPSQVYTDGIKMIGNTLLAAVFFGLHDALKRNLFDKSNRVILGTFGAELQIGAVLLLPQKVDLILS